MRSIGWSKEWLLPVSVGWLLGEAFKAGLVQHLLTLVAVFYVGGYVLVSYQRVRSLRETRREASNDDE